MSFPKRNIMPLKPGQQGYKKSSVGMRQGRVFPFPETTNSWNLILNYIKNINDIRKNMCGGCGKGVLYDKNNVRYEINRRDSLDKVIEIVEQIRKVNSEDVG